MNDLVSVDASSDGACSTYLVRFVLRSYQTSILLPTNSAHHQSSSTNRKPGRNDDLLGICNQLLQSSSSGCRHPMVYKISHLPGG